MSPSTGNLNLPSTKAVISAAATVATTTMIIRSFTRDFIPAELRHYFFTKLYRFLSTFTTDTTLIIDEFDGLNKNHLFFASELYLTTVITPHAKTFRATLAEMESSINVALAGNEEVIDKFRGVAMKWRLVSEKARVMQRYGPYPEDSAYRSEVKCLKLTFHRSYKTMVIEEYLPYVLERSKAVKEERKTLKLHTLKNERMHGIRGSPWQPVNLDHPANFETLAMDGDDKKMIVDDLDRFVRRREFYRKVGKAWKRGYLLFGPPGTGKSSLIAAIANYLNFDVYDLELTDIRCNSDLRRLLIATANRSILVVEDIDASIDLSERKAAVPKPPPGMYPYQYSQGPKITLSGLLNFIDGLWSSCGDERIIIFTTNHKDKIDPALLRPGRMDVHIHMSFCTPCGFKMLLNNYLGITEHPLLSEAEELIAWTKVTPAEVGEQLLKTDDPGLALQGLINFLEQKKESGKAKEENLEVTEPEVELKKEKKEEGSKKMKSVFKGTDGLNELTKLSKASPELRHKILEKDDVANALKTLVKFLEGENGTEDAKDSGASLGSFVDAQQESGKEHGIKIE